MTKNIHEAILAIMGEVDYVQKERKSGVNYSIKSEEGVLNAIRPAMIKNSVIMFPVDVRDSYHSTYEAGQHKNLWNRVIATHVYRFVHVPTETHIDVAVLGDGADMGDKAGNKSMTTSKKYALLETFLLRTGDDPDDTPSPNDKKKTNARLWTTAQKGWLIEAGYTQNEISAKHTLDKSNLPGNAKKATVLQWGKYYRAKRDKDKTSDEAAKFANDKYEKRGK